MAWIEDHWSVVLALLAVAFYAGQLEYTRRSVVRRLDAMNGTQKRHGRILAWLLTTFGFSLPAHVDREDA